MAPETEPGSPSSSSSGKQTKKEKAVYACKVCGDATTGLCFGALVCQSCKTFFIRCEVDRAARFFICLNGNQCIMTRVSRTFCKRCRLMKCYQVGMKRKDRPETIEPAHGQELCVVCNDLAAGIHFGKYTCEGCKKFFRRTLKSSAKYRCRRSEKCVINPRTRTRCRFCRFKKCIDVGLLSKARGSRLLKLQRDARKMQTPGVPGASPNKDQERERKSTYATQCKNNETSLTTEQTENRPHDKTRNTSEIPTPPTCPDKLCQVIIGDMTYLLSESLGLRYVKVILPYWTQPQLPPGHHHTVYGPQEQAALEQLIVSHSRAVEDLQGPKPSAEIIAEALISNEVSENVGLFQRRRLVRTMLAFLGLIESEQILSGLSEEHVTNTVRLTVNTWALIGVTCRFFSPEVATLPHLHDLPLHPKHPHAPVTACNLNMARKLHALRLDEAEAALLALSCILATDLFEVKEPGVVEKKRWEVLELFRAYTSAKYGWPNSRLEELFACVPEMRLIAIWFNDLSHTTWYSSKSKD